MIANAIAETYRDFRIKSNLEISSNESTSSPTLVYPAPSILEHATPSIVPARSNKALNIALGASVGAVLGVLVAGAAVGFQSAVRGKRARRKA